MPADGKLGLVVDWPLSMSREIGRVWLVVTNHTTGYHRYLRQRYQRPVCLTVTVKEAKEQESIIGWRDGGFLLAIGRIDRVTPYSQLMIRALGYHPTGPESCRDDTINSSGQPINRFMRFILTKPRPVLPAPEVTLLLNKTRYTQKVWK